MTGPFCQTLTRTSSGCDTGAGRRRKDERARKASTDKMDKQGKGKRRVQKEEKRPGIFINGRAGRIGACFETESVY